MHCCQLVAECNGPWYSEEGDEAKGRNSVLCKGAQLVRVTNCPWKFWSAGEPDLGLPGLVRSLISWDDCAPVQWWRGWKTKTGRRAAAKGAKLGRYVATEIEKLTHIRIWIWITTSKTLWNSLEKKTLEILFKILHIWVWFAWKSLTSHLSLGSGFQGRVGQDLGGEGGWIVAFDFTA